MDRLKHPHTLATLEALCLMGTGLIAGATTYISLVEVPARDSNASTSYQLENYHQLFPRAAYLMKNFGAVLSAVTIITAILTEKKTWCIPIFMVGAIGPFTAVAIQPTNDKLMAATDGEQVKDELIGWRKLHKYRTYMTLVGFAGAVAAVMSI